jgi:hypothetical protein
MTSPPLTDSPSIVPVNERTATIALLAAALSLLPLIPISYVTYFSAHPIPVHQLHGAWFLLLITATPFLAVVGLGTAAMALDGKLTLYIGFAVGISYVVGILTLAAALILFLLSQPHSPATWCALLLASLLAVATLFAIYHRRQSRAARFLQSLS